MQKWRGLEVDVFVHVYSLSLTSLSHFKNAKKALIDPYSADRSGAASLVVVQELVKELKEIHKHNYVASTITWNMWANIISKAEVHLQEAMKHEAPPEHLISLFSRAPTHADDRLQTIRSNFQLATTVSDSYASDLSQLRVTVNEIRELAKAFTTLADDLDKRLKVCENKRDCHNEMLGAANVVIEESSFSVRAFNDISNHEDIDHII